MSRLYSRVILNLVLVINLLITTYLYLISVNIFIFLLLYLFLIVPVNTVFMFNLLNKTKYVIKLSEVLVIRFPKNDYMRLHLISHFEIIKLLFKKRKSKSIKRFIYMEIIKGIFNLRKYLEENNYQDTKIVAISHFFNEKTMNRMGFKNEKLDLINRMRFLSDVFAMLILNFFIYKKINFKKTMLVKKATTDYLLLSKSLKDIENGINKLSKEDPEIIKNLKKTS